jgi:hypothetical protein
MNGDGEVPPPPGDIPGDVSLAQAKCCLIASEPFL